MVAKKPVKKSHRAVTAKIGKQFHKSAFGIDPESKNEIYPGYTSGQTWNGWECPFFEFNIAKKILGDISKSDGAPTKYSKATDTFTLSYNDPDNDPEPWPGVDIIYNGVLVHVYPIGAWSWCWDEYTTEDIREMGSVSQRKKK